MQASSRLAGGGLVSPRAGRGAGGGAGMAPSPTGPVGQQPMRDEGAPDAQGEPNAEAREDRPDERDEPKREEREPLMRADDRTLPPDPRSASPVRAPSPVTPPEQPRHAGDDDSAAGYSADSSTAGRVGAGRGATSGAGPAAGDSPGAAPAGCSV